MVFYYFGPDRSSWAFGNDKFALANNLPESLQTVWDQLGDPFQDKQMAGTQIQWMASASDGRYAIMTKNGDLLTNCDDLLNTVVEQLQSRYGTSVDFIAFSPLGGWFIRYGDSTVQLSGRFPDVFYAMASPYLQLTGPDAHSRQASMIQSIFFGSGQSFVFKTGFTLHWNGITQKLADSFNSLTTAANTFYVGSNTVLCPWSNDFYLIEADPILSGEKQYVYELPTGDTVSAELLVQLASNLRPPDHLIPRVSLAPQASSQPTQGTVPDSAPSNVPASLRPPTIPANMRRRYEQQFDANSGGRDYIIGSDAAHILLDTGLDRKVLSEIWELIDEDRNGKLDKEEFVNAMWQVDTRRTGTDVSIRWAVAALTCDGCSCGLNIGEEAYFCSICGGGDFDLCLACYAKPFKRCQHALSRVFIQLPSNATIRHLPGSSATCDGCATELTDGTIVYCCQICNGGDYDICEACWKIRRTCGHPLALCKLQAAIPTNLSSNPSTVQPIPTPNFSDTSRQGPPSDVDKLSKQFMDSSLKDSLISSILSEKPNVKWEDVAGLEAAKAELQEAIIFPLRFPQMFRGKRQPRRALLLYGPPGTGKSYLAKAVATEVDHTLFSVSSSDVMSKWTGESEGLMRQLFVLAREKKPSIIFIDEIDALCGKRDNEGPNAEDTARMKTEFLVQMDGLGNNNDGVFVLAATNLPWSLDPAVRRRFQKRIHVPLPDDNARVELFKVHLGDMVSSLGNIEGSFRDLAWRTNGFSGSDISNLVQDALMMPVKKVHSASYFRKIRDRDGEWYTPCNANDQGAMPMKWNRVPARQLKEPPLTIGDLYDAVHKTKPSVGEEEVRKCNEWTQQYGMEGA
ncbi:Vacuolar protein sorting-associated protein 4 [Neonectria ditissima]|uniref:Vacuolar protein sorting-associated protein 4 n=1 Tax=Neonectria ditissima TaxID=78410 RepID=A0A0P7AEZ9_9HYPO|nr:Vacuolar protein sorting-associated protein 4 [Neonectria ditissima]